MQKLSVFFSPYLLSASAALAAGAEKLADGTEKASKGGLPQFDPTWFVSQFFWLVIAFGLLYFIFSKISLPEISSVIENRKNQINADLEAAEKLTAEAEDVHQAYENNLAQSNANASEELAKAEAKIKAKFDKKQEEFRLKSEEEIQVAETRILASKDQVMNDMSQVVAEVAATAVEKITGTQTDTAKIQSIVERIDGSKSKAKAA
ncbi:MAG: hypothetical protein AAF549_05335 [Pseudomonadota bacterium]